MTVKLFVYISILVVSAVFATAEYSLTVLHTNDVHACFESICKYFSSCEAMDKTAEKCFREFIGLVTAVAQPRQRAANSILVMAAINFRKHCFIFITKGKLAAEMMNTLGYDAMTVGNHEFDDGPQVLSGSIDAVKLPVLMSNADIGGELLLSDKIAKSALIERGRETFGLIGLTPLDTEDLASPGDNIRFMGPVAAVQREVDQLTQRGVNKIIVLSHSGYGVV